MHAFRCLVGLALLLSSAPAAEARPAVEPDARVTVEVRLEAEQLPEGLESLPELRWEVRPAGEGLESGSGTLLHTSAPGEPLRLELPEGRWILSLVAGDAAPWFWASPLGLEIPGRGDPESTAAVLTESLVLRPAGRVEGELQPAAPGESPPEDLVVFFRPRSGEGGDELAPGKTPCELELLDTAEPARATGFSCLLPAGSFDLRFDLAGFVPRYRWDQRVEAGASRRLGRVELIRGAAIQGWVLTEDGVAEGARVHLSPALADRIPGETGRLETRRRTVRANDRGFFEILGVPAGAHRLEAEVEGWMPARGEVLVAEAQTTTVAEPPLVLRRPAFLELVVSPEVAPEGESWLLSISTVDKGTLSDFWTSVGEHPVAPDGTLRVEGLAPGSYGLRLEAPGGETWWTDKLDLEGETPLWVELPLVEVTGRWEFGGEPLPVKLTFGGFFGDTRFPVRPEKDGRFRVTVPHGGLWPVAVEMEEPPVSRELRLLVDPDGEGEAKVEVSLPATRLVGRVEDRAGEPVPGARLQIQSLRTMERPPRVRSEADGSFEVWGLPEGAVVVAADAGERVSEAVSVTLKEERDLDPVVLVVEPVRWLHGTVASAQGAVPGAFLRGRPLGAPHLGSVQGTADAEGRFRLRIPSGTRDLDLEVAAPGFAWRLLRLPIPTSGEELHQLGILLEPAAGQLVIAEEGWKSIQDERFPEEEVRVLWHRGASTALWNLRGWARLRAPGAPAAGIGPDLPRGPLVVPEVEPGEYRLCALPWSALTVARAAGVDPLTASGRRPRCVAGTLSAGGSLELSLEP